MKLKLTRRQFGQLAIASTVAAGIGYLAKRTSAQTSLVIYGVSAGPVNFSDTTDLGGKEKDTHAGPPVTLSIPLTLNMTLSIPLTLNIQSYVVAGNSINQVATHEVLNSNEQISGFTYLTNNTPVVTINPTNGSSNENDPTRLVVLDSSLRTVKLSALNQQEKLVGLVGINDSECLGLVTKKNGGPPAQLVNINVQTGEITDKDQLDMSENQRYSTLAWCPDGTIYTISLAPDGTSTLVQLNQDTGGRNNLARLSFNNSDWNGGVQSLICAPGKQLFLLGKRRYEGRFYLHSLEPSSGKITRITEFNVSQIAVLP